MRTEAEKQEIRTWFENYLQREKNKLRDYCEQRGIISLPVKITMGNGFDIDGRIVSFRLKERSTFDFNVDTRIDVEKKSVERAYEILTLEPIETGSQSIIFVYEAENATIRDEVILKTWNIQHGSPVRSECIGLPPPVEEFTYS